MLWRGPFTAAVVRYAFGASPQSNATGKGTGPTSTGGGSLPTAVIIVRLSIASNTQRESGDPFLLVHMAMSSRMDRASPSWNPAAQHVQAFRSTLACPDQLGHREIEPGCAESF